MTGDYCMRVLLSTRNLCQGKKIHWREHTQGLRSTHKEEEVLTGGRREHSHDPENAPPGFLA